MGKGDVSSADAVVLVLVLRLLLLLLLLWPLLLLELPFRSLPSGNPLRVKHILFAFKLPSFLFRPFSV